MNNLRRGCNFRKVKNTEAQINCLVLKKAYNGPLTYNIKGKTRERTGNDAVMLRD